MTFNYHTHTIRCGHAEGTDREYVEAAIKRGLKILGFSDHAPYIIEGETECERQKKQDQIFDYAQSIRALAKEYEKELKILCGFELEYCPETHDEEKEFLAQVNPDYLILGQHFVGSDRTVSTMSHDKMAIPYTS